MPDVAIVSFAQTPFSAREEQRDEVELVRYAVNEARRQAGVERAQIGFTCSGSCDYIQGLPFSFVAVVDALGAWPPIAESHVEMDGAWALYEAYIRLQHGDLDLALAFCFSKPSLGDLADVMAQQLDPYSLAPLWPDPDSLAGLQARALLDAGGANPEDFAAVAARSLRAALDNPAAHAGRDVTPQQLLDAPFYREPLRQSDCATQSDGAAAVVLATAARARDLEQQNGRAVAWIRGIDHRIEPGQLGLRDLTVSQSTARAGAAAGVGEGPVDVAELHACYSHQEPILRRALGLPGETPVNPSGGCFGANAPMVAGLCRLGEAAARVFDGRAERAVAHATQGPCLQQNLVCVLEGR